MTIVIFVGGCWLAYRLGRLQERRPDLLPDLGRQAWRWACG